MPRRRKEYALSDELVLEMYETKTATQISAETGLEFKYIANILVRNNVKKTETTGAGYVQHELLPPDPDIKPLPDVGGKIKFNNIIYNVIEIYKHFILTLHPNGYRACFKLYDEWSVCK